MDSRVFESFKEAATYAAECAKTRAAVVSVKQLGTQWQVVIPDSSAIGAERNPVNSPNKFENLDNPEDLKSLKDLEDLQGPENGPRHADNRYRFSVQRQSYRGAEFAENLEREKAKIVDCVLEFFPNAAVEARIDLAAFDGDYNTYHRNYFIVVTFTDLSISSREFNDYLRDLRRVLHV